MFMTLYYTGIREGEMLALTSADINLEKATIRISKNYQIVNGEEMITSPKTPKSNRVVTTPALLVKALRDYMGLWYGLEQNDRIFTYTKNIVNHVMARACEAVGVKKIRVHDIRHSHASMLVELVFSTFDCGAYGP